MAATARSPNKLKPRVAYIFVNITFTEDFMGASTSYVFLYFNSFLVLFILNYTFFFIISYNLPVNVGSKRSIPFPAFSLVGLFCVFDVSYTISVSFITTYVSLTSASLYLELFMLSMIFEI